MRQDESYKLEELAERAGMSVRTVRYYLQRGLLEPPPFRGKDTAYGPDHLVRLRAIRRLQERFLPLDAIQAELAGRSAAEMERIASSPAPMPSAHAAAARVGQDAAKPGLTERMERGVRVHLAPGVELWISESATPADRRLAERARAWLMAERDERREGRRGDD